MAGAEALKNLELEKLQVPERLVKGSKFIKWPKSDSDDTIVAIPVTLRLDPNGYILYWQEPHKDTECLDVSNIRDTRIGKYAKIPKSERWEKAVQSSPDPQIGEVAGNQNIPLELKCLTVVYGMKFPEPNFINFIAVEENPHELVKMWSDFLLELAIHPLTWHISVETAIEKMYTRLKYETNQFGQIPVRKCIKMFAGNSKRVENALTSVGLIKGKKDEVIDPTDFPLIAFKRILQLTCLRPELDKVFAQLGAKRMYLQLDQLKEFLNHTQRDPRLNEIIYPFLTDEQVETIIQKYEPNIMLSKRGQLSLEGLDAYLQSDENLCVSTAKYALHSDMSQPLSHYFINSSHNTYLTGTQYKSKSTAEIYRQCLLAGCRCVELDCWEERNPGGDQEPYITHGFTLCSEVPFKDVIEAINESAFKTSQYPVILSFENHVDNPAQQAKMAQYCRDIFGDKLLIDPLESNPLKSGIPLPTPKDLMGKIIIKNKKQKGLNEGIKKPPNEEKSPLQASNSFDSSSQDLEKPKREEKSSESDSTPNSTPKTPKNKVEKGDSPINEVPPILEESSSEPDKNPENGEKNDEPEEKGENEGIKEPPKDKNANVKLGEIISKIDETETKEDGPTNDVESTKEKGDDDDESDDEGSISLVEFDQNAEECGTAMKESKAYEAMSSLVNYIQPVRFKAFEFSEKKNRSYEISSFTETAALRLLSYWPVEFVNYNKRQMSRIYPKGARMDSSNYNPQLFWNAGCQLVALNFQTLDSAMQLNLALFEFNGNSGFLLKPDHMRRKDRQFDPFTENIMDGVVAADLSIKIISGQFLSASRVSTFVEVDMYGLVTDTRKKKFRTSTVSNNGMNPHYDASPFEFEKVVLPSMAMLRIGVMDNNGNCLGQRFLPVEGLRPGYRYITLRNEGNQPLTMPSLFVYIEVKDYIPKKLEDFAIALANPIEFVKQREEEEKEIKSRMNALNRLLDDKEQQKLPKDLILRDKGNEKPQIIFEGDTPDGSIPSNQVSVTVHVGKTPEEEENSPSTPVSGKPLAQKKSSIDQLEAQFDPASLDDFKKEKSYRRLQEDLDKRVTKQVKRLKEDYDVVYRILFDQSRRLSLLEKIKGKSKCPSVPFDIDSSKPAEVKRDQMLTLLRKHFEDEKGFRHRELQTFMKNLEDLMSDFQKRELMELGKIDKSESEVVQKRKNEEKDQKVRRLQHNLTKDQLDQRKLEIINMHIQECVRDLKMLESIQKKRREDVIERQKEILRELNNEERNRIDEIDNLYKQNLIDIEKIFDIRRAELVRKKGNNSISSVTYPNGANDGDYTTIL